MYGIDYLPLSLIYITTVNSCYCEGFSGVFLIPGNKENVLLFQFGLDGSEGVGVLPNLFVFPDFV